MKINWTPILLALVIPVFVALMWQDIKMHSAMWQADWERLKKRRQEEADRQAQIRELMHGVSDQPMVCPDVCCCEDFDAETELRPTVAELSRTVDGCLRVSPVTAMNAVHAKPWRN